MTKKYTHIFFDLDNTLWDLKKNSKVAMQITFRKYRKEIGEINFDEFYRVYERINHSLWEKYRKKEVDKKELILRRFADSFAELKVKGPDPGEMNENYLDEMAKQKALCKGTVETLEYLKRKNYKLYIITNGFKEVQNKKLKSSGLDIFFEKVFTSEEVQMPKPGQRIFESAIKSANARKSTSLMIGDDWDVDVLGAVNFGIDAVFVEKNKSDVKGLTETDLLKQKVYIVSEVDELRIIL